MGWRADGAEKCRLCRAMLRFPAQMSKKPRLCRAMQALSPRSASSRKTPAVRDQAKRIRAPARRLSSSLPCSTQPWFFRHLGRKSSHRSTQPTFFCTIRPPAHSIGVRDEPKVPRLSVLPGIVLSILVRGVAEASRRRFNKEMVNRWSHQAFGVAESTNIKPDVAITTNAGDWLAVWYHAVMRL